MVFSLFIYMVDYIDSLGTGEITQQLRALAALAEVSGTVPSTHMAAHNHL